MPDLQKKAVLTSPKNDIIASASNRRPDALDRHPGFYLDAFCHRMANGPSDAPSFRASRFDRGHFISSPADLFLGAPTDTHGFRFAVAMVRGSNSRRHASIQEFSCNL